MIRKAGSITWRALLRFFDHNGPDRAAAVAYYILLSLLPLLIFLVSLGVRLLGSFEAAYSSTMFLIGGVVVHLDQVSLDALRTFVTSSTRFQWFGILLLAWTSKRIFAALFSALETVFQVPGRSFAHGNLLSFGMVLVTSLAMLLTLALTTFLAGVEGLLLRYAPPAAGALLQNVTSLLLTRGLPVAITFVFFYILYRVGPRRAVTPSDALVGALLATVLWEGAKSGFNYYVRHFARFAGLYGALEGIIVLALWLELSVSIILYCGEVVALLLPDRKLGAEGTASVTSGNVAQGQ